MIAYTVAELAVPWFLLSSAETRLTSSLSGLLVAAVPLVGPVLAWATRSEHQLAAAGWRAWASGWQGWRAAGPGRLRP